MKRLIDEKPVADLSPMVQRLYSEIYGPRFNEPGNVVRYYADDGDITETVCSISIITPEERELPKLVGRQQKVQFTNPNINGKPEPKR